MKNRESYRHGHLPEDLHMAVLELVTEGGARAFSLAAAARRAGVSNSAPYRHYRSREDLLASVAAATYRRLVLSLETVRLDQADPVEQLAGMAAEFVRFASQNRAGTELVFAAGIDKPNHPELAALNDAAYKQFRAAADLVVEDSDTAHRLVIGAASVAHGIYMLLVDGSLPAVGFDERLGAAQAAEYVRWMAVGLQRQRSPESP